MYEKFRNDFVLELAELPSETTNIIINALDRVALKYEFTQKELSLITYKKRTPQHCQIISCRQKDGRTIRWNIKQL